MSEFQYVARKEHYGWVLFDTKSYSVHRVDSHYINELEKHYSIRRVSNNIIEGALTAPIKVFIDITNKCNLKCLHCHSDSKPESDINISFGKMKEIIDECYNLGVFVIKLSGGELLLRDDIWKIAEIIRTKGMGLTMATNGTILSNYIIEMIKKYNVKIGVSLDGCEETHDKIRGKGVYRKALDTLTQLVSAGINTKIHFTLMTKNLNEIYHMVELSKKLNVTLKVVRAKPLNRAIDNGLALEHINNEYIKGISLLNECEQCKTEDIMKIDRGQASQIILNPLDCGAGTRVLSIRANGDVSPCAFLGKEYVGGNINKDKISEIWKNSNQFYMIRNMPFNSNCLACERKDFCHGGCPAMSLYNTGRLNGIDPGCLAESVSY